MMSRKFNLVGQNFTPPDVVAKVTGEAKYAEDFRAEGMLFAKMLLSPMPHGRVRRLDVSRAERMPGVVAILTADDVPKVKAPQEPILTNQPRFVGDPIVAVAAVDEATAAAAIEAIDIDLEPLPFVLDPLESLRPGGPDIYPEGNIFRPTGFPLDEFGVIDRIKWTESDFAGDGKTLPMGKPTVDWTVGDVEGGFKQADLILDETFVTQSNSHHSMEPGSAMAYWQNGKCYLHLSTQSPAHSIPGAAKMLDIAEEDLVLISEYMGGGFGAKGLVNPRQVKVGVPALLSRKLNGRPVMLRVTRAEEYFFGRCRPAFQGRIKIGFRADGRITAIDLFIVQSNGPYAGWQDHFAALESVSLKYQPKAMRGRGIPVFTNTPPPAAQRGPGGTQMSAAIEPIIDKAAGQLGLDRVEIRKINSPGHGALQGDHGEEHSPITTSYIAEALDVGAKKFNWEEKLKLSGTRQGDKLIGFGVGTAPNVAGWTGYDGLVVIKPDGKLYIHSGEGNLGTYSYAATARVAAEVLNMPWDKCEVVWGNTGYHLPWSPETTASSSAYTGSRTKYVAAMDARKKLQEIAAMDLGGSPDDYDVADGKVFLKSDPSRSLSFAEAASRALELGGKYSGHEIPDDLDPLTVRSAQGVAGTGLVGVAKDKLGDHGEPNAFVAAFAQVEVDVLTGKVSIVDYLGVVDCGRVMHPMSLGTQVFGGATQGFGYALNEGHVFDHQHGWPATKGLYTMKPFTYLDIPPNMEWKALDKPDTTNPMGVKGVGEPLMGAAAAAVLGAVADALGGKYFLRTPVTPDMVLNELENQPQPYGPYDVHV